MSLVKVVTKKEMDWKGRVEDFTNVYYFGDGNLTNPSEAEVTTLLNKVIAQERTIFSSAVRFQGALGYVGWNTPGDTEALASVSLVPANNLGTAPFAAAMYRECAIDVQFALGGKRFLRSMLHTISLHGLEASGLSEGAPATAITTWAANMAGNTHYAPFRRMSPDGTAPGGYVVKKYLEHRQFHRYRRRYD